MRLPLPMLLLGALLAAGAAEDGAAEDGAALRAGRTLYRSGAGQDAVGVQGPGGRPLPTARFSCLGCHGADGGGRTEGGLRVPAIGPDALGPDAAGRIGRALGGRDVMPAYALSSRDQDALQTYLAVIGTEADQDPGVTVDALRVAIVLPGCGGASEPDGPDGAAALAEFAALNARGGIFGRRLAALPLSGSPGAVAAAAERDDAFALVSLVPLGADALPFITRARIPVLAPGTAGAEALPFVYSLPPRAQGAVRMLAEALRRSGRQVSRERLRAELDGLRASDAAALPPAGLDPFRQSGVVGAGPIGVGERGCGQAAAPGDGRN